MEIKFKYRPEVTSIEDLQEGDRFLVGDERWVVGSLKSKETKAMYVTVNGVANGLARKLIRANVPIERDIPYPEGGAEKWELREGDDETRTPKGTLHWWEGEWVDDAIHVLARNRHLRHPQGEAARQGEACSQGVHGGKCRTGQFVCVRRVRLPTRR
jgi:hypothetical protein